MKIITKILIFPFLVIIWENTLMAQDQIKIDKQLAWKIIKEQVLKENYEHFNVYMSKDVLMENQELDKIQRVFSPSYASYFFFIDEMPFANWDHPCKYCFVNAKTGEIEIIDSDTPPNFENLEILNFVESSQEFKL